jgi:predicted outer membrane lipoprotein
MKMLASTVTDPPVVPKQTIEFKGTVWRSDATPFGVVRAEWLEKTTKKERNREETRRLTLLASGWETPPAEPVDRGKDFSVWRLIFGR